VKYNFLNQSKFIIIDYVPGSSGQLLLRLWAELDNRVNYNNDTILSNPINENPASTEIDYDIQLTKKIVNWFLEKTEPQTVEDYLTFFEYLGNTLTALDQRWNKTSKVKFYENGKDIDYNDIVLYGMHTKHSLLPLAELKERAPNLQIISIVPQTKEGKDYQYNRACACYSKNKQRWSDIIEAFNNKQHSEVFDLCTFLANRDTFSIINFLKKKIPEEHFLDHKVQKATHILNLYYDVVVSNLERKDV
jgi:hypothetical protein